MPKIIVHPNSERAINQFVAKPSHAVLLTGGKGLGKTYLAHSIATKLLGEPGAELANHPYYRHVVPIKNVITIEQVRELMGFFRLAVPGSARIKRAAVIEDADLMGLEAQNALLKLLEEPPQGSVLILTASRALGLLPTIRSRTQTISIQTPDEPALQRHFQSLGFTPTEVSHALLRGGENIASVQQLLSGGEDGQDTVIELVKHLLGSSTYERLLEVEVLAKQKDQATRLVDTLVQVAGISLEAAAKRQSPAMERWQNILQASYSAQSALAGNGNPKLVLTDLMLSL